MPIAARKCIWSPLPRRYVRALWKQAVDLGLVIELHIGPNYALQAADAIRAFPGCKVLIDHMGEPKLGNPYEYANMLELAKLPNVYMKLSGIDYIATDAPNFESVTALHPPPDQGIWPRTRGVERRLAQAGRSAHEGLFGRRHRQGQGRQSAKAAELVDLGHAQRYPHRSMK